MKLILSLIISLALVWPSDTVAQSNTNSPVDPKSTIVVCGVAIGICIVAGYVIIKIKQACPPRPGQLLDVTLYKSTDGRATWQVVDEKIIQITTTWQDAFREEMTDSSAFYRATWRPWP